VACEAACGAVACAVAPPGTPRGVLTRNATPHAHAHRSSAFWSSESPGAPGVNSSSDTSVSCFVRDAEGLLDRFMAEWCGYGR
jgi:hypothetical protein